MNERVLVVEDNADNMKLITWALEDAGYAVLPATTAEQALCILESETVQMVLMDISLPGINGKEATKLLRSQPRFANLPILAVTAHAVIGESQAIMDSGVSALVTKPIDEDALLETMRSFLMKEPI